MKVSNYSRMAAAVAAFLSHTCIASSVLGTVTDTQGQPLSDVRVSVEGSNQRTFTDAQGQFRLDNLRPTHIHLHLYSPAHVHGDREIIFTSDDDQQRIDFRLQPTRVENVLVTANALSSSVLESTAAVTVVSGEDLRNRQAPTLGDTLNGIPGVHSSYFGPVASSPIIRGSDGPRVKIVQNGLDVSDASRIGPDHGVGAEGSTASQIEVLRGPATLQFGSGAIGGVINVVDQRIPTHTLDTPTGEVELRHDTRSNERYAKVDINASAGQFGLHADGFARKTDDIDIPGYAEREPDEDEAPGTLENSDIDANGYTIGTSFITDRGYFGVAYQSMDNLYGIPGHAHGHDEDEDHDDEDHDEGDEDHEEEEESVSLDANVERIQMAAELFSPLPNIERLSYRAAVTDYEHKEIEGDAIGTIFKNKSQEHRLDIQHEAFKGWHGVIGLHHARTEFKAIGEEAYTPPNTSHLSALFIVEEKRIETLSFQVGARIENNQLELDEDVTIGLGEPGTGELTVNRKEHDFSSISVSAGTIWEYSQGYSMGLSFTHSERAPSHQELFSAGEHISTRTYDLGLAFRLSESGELLINEDVREETANNIELSWRKFQGDFDGSVSVFYNRLDGFIYQRNSGRLSGGEGELPVYTFEQDSAVLYGFETSLALDFMRYFKVELTGDMIRAELDSGEALPRIPPLRLGINLGFDTKAWSGDIGASWYQQQDRVARFETASDSYTLIDARVNYRIPVGSSELTAFAIAHNLSDEEARPHTSFIKDQAPLPGRGVSLGLRMSF